MNSTFAFVKTILYDFSRVECVYWKKEIKDNMRQAGDTYAYKIFVCKVGISRIMIKHKSQFDVKI